MTSRVYTDDFTIGFKNIFCENSFYVSHTGTVSIDLAVVYVVPSSTVSSESSV